MQQSSMKKVVKSKVAAQKWLWWSDNGKIFYNNNSGEFVTHAAFFLHGPHLVFTVWLFLCRSILFIRIATTISYMSIMKIPEVYKIMHIYKRSLFIFMSYTVHVIILIFSITDSMYMAIKELNLISKHTLVCHATQENGACTQN